MAKGTQEAKRILLAFPETYDWNELETVLNESGYQTQSANSIEDCLHKVRAWSPHLIIINENLNRLGPVDLLDRLHQHDSKNSENMHSLMTVMILQNPDSDFIARIVDEGADDVFIEPVNLVVLLAKIKALLRQRDVLEQLRRANQKLKELTYTDSQTGLLKMHYVQERLKEEVQRSRRSKSQLACIMFDIDDFKDLIESFDHETANSVINNTGKLIRMNTREIDICGHHGGDEFVLVLPDTGVEGAKIVAERINRAITKYKIERDRKRMELSACFGISSIDHLFQEDSQGLLKRAERALKTAKIYGKGSVHVAD